jgi:hypothetical protein
VGSPLIRWQARAALAIARRAQKGAGDDADRLAREAADIVHAIAKDLSPERAATYLAARPVIEALALSS